MEIIWTNIHLIIPGAIVLAVVLVMLVFSYRQKPNIPLPLKLLAGTMKLLGCVTLLIFILEPKVATKTHPPGVNHWAVLVDTSGSMKLKDQKSGRSRADRVTSALSSNARPWEIKLNQEFIVNNFSYDTKVNLLQRDQLIDFEGNGSSLGQALETLKNRYKNQPLAGILVLTDGCHTDTINTKDLPPVYPLVIKPEIPLKDLAVTSLTTQESLFEDSPLVVNVTLSAVGLKGEDCLVILREFNGKELTQYSTKISTDSDLQTVRLEVKPEKKGTTFVEASVHLLNHSIQEVITKNNTRLAAVNQKQGPYRVLYIGGRPNYEHKFLQRALEGDASIRLTSLIRIAKREPKFSYRGRKGEESNPLYRGFDDQEDAERFDEAVFMRLNTKYPGELANGFPKTPEELFPFEAVIIDDIEADFFKADQMQLLQRFVSERGGSLIMLGGMESLDLGGYHNTTIGSLLPVYLDRGTPEGAPVPAKLNLTREGFLEPWARLRKSRAAEKTRLEQMPIFENVHTIPEVRPGSVTIASLETEYGDFPALVTRRYGNGRTAALTVSNLWRWGFEDPSSRKDLETTWRQLTRWLLSDVPRPLTIAPELTSSSTTQLTTTLLGDDFLPMESGNIKLSVTRPDNSNSQISLSPNPEKVGVLQTSYQSTISGPYLAQASFHPDNTVDAITAQTGWVSNSSQDEFLSTQPNIPQLEQLARETKGELLTLDQLPTY